MMRVMNRRRASSGSITAEGKRLCEEGLQAGRLEDGGLASAGLDKPLSLEPTQGADGRLVSDAGKLGQLLAGERDGGAELLCQREKDLRQSQVG